MYRVTLTSFFRPSPTTYSPSSPTASTSIPTLNRFALDCVHALSARGTVYVQRPRDRPISAAHETPLDGRFANAVSAFWLDSPFSRETVWCQTMIRGVTPPRVDELRTNRVRHPGISSAASGPGTVVVAGESPRSRSGSAISAAGDRPVMRSSWL